MQSKRCIICIAYFAKNVKPALQKNKAKYAAYFAKNVKPALQKNKAKYAACYCSQSMIALALRVVIFNSKAQTGCATAY